MVRKLSQGNKGDNDLEWREQRLLIFTSKPNIYNCINDDHIFNNHCKKSIRIHMNIEVSAKDQTSDIMVEFLTCLSLIL